MKNLKTIFACLLMAVLSIGQVWAASPDNYSFSSFTSAATVNLTTTDGFGITLAKNNGSSNPAWSSNQARVYAKGSLTISIPAAGDYKITSITYTYVVNKNKSGVAPTIDGVSGTGDAGSWNSSSKTWTASGDGATSVAFTTSGTAGNVGFTAVSITYTTSGGGGDKPAVSFEPAAGKYATTQSVTLTSEGADHIYYTTDGTAPSDQSAEYSTAISVSETTTIKAFAVKGEVTGDVASATYTFPYTTIQALLPNITTTTETAHYTKMTNWIVTGVATDGKNAFLTDGTEYGILAYSNSIGFTRGQILNGTIDINAKIWKQVPELTNLKSTTEGVTKTTGGVPTVYDNKTIGDLTINNQGIVVKLSNVTYSASAGTLSDGENTIKVVNAIYSGLSLTDTKSYNITGVVAYTTDNNKTLQIYPRDADDIEEISAAGAPEAPSFNIPAGKYTEAQTVTISCETDGVSIYYTLDGSAPSSSSTLYTTPIEISSRKTLKAIAIKDDLESAVTTADYNFPFASVAELFAYLKVGAEDEITTLSEVTVSGKVSQIVTAYTAQNGYITYNISDDGLTTSDQLQSYKGIKAENTNFSSADDIVVGDEVTIYGNYKKFVSGTKVTRELDQNNYLVARKYVSSIVVKTAPTKTEYTEDEYFDPTGLKITAKYSTLTATDVETEDVAYAGNEDKFTFSPALTDVLTTSDNVVTITYRAKSIDQAITVAAKGCQDPTVAFAEAGPINKLTTAAAFTNTASVTLNDNPTGQTITYSGDNDAVAEVNSATGEVTINGAGTVHITATAAEVANTYCEASESYTLVVSEPAHEYQYTHDFTDIDMSSWSGYASHTINYDIYVGHEGNDDHVTFVSASKQTSNITNMPVAKDGAVNLILDDPNKYISAVKFVGAQWTTKAQTIVLKYSTDGGTTFTAFSPSKESTNFTIEELNLPENVNAVQVAGQNSSNQIGYASVSFDLVDKVIVKKTVTITAPDAEEGTLVVKNAGVAITSGDEIEVGTTLTIEAIASDGYSLSGVSVKDEDDDDVEVTSNSFVVPNKNVTVSATFVVDARPQPVIAIDNMALTFTQVATITPTVTGAASASDVTYEIKAGSDDCITLEGSSITAKSVEGTATIVASIAGTDDWKPATKEFTVTVSDPRYKAERTAFTALEGKVATVSAGTHKDKEYISYATFKGTGTTDPKAENNILTFYKPASGKSTGGYIMISAVKGCTIDEVQVTNAGSKSTTIGCSTTSTLATSGTAYGLNATVSFNNLNSSVVYIDDIGSERVDITKLVVYYTGEPAAIHHYKLDGTYTTVFEQNTAFSHEGLVVYACYDALEEDKVDITNECTFTDPDMNTVGEQTIEITYNSAVVTSYTITVTAGKALPNLVYTPATLTITKGDDWSAPELTYASGVTGITYESNKPAVATVDENGVIALAGGYGTAVITASLAENDDFVAGSATYTITVNEPQDNLTGTWNLVTDAADLKPGVQVIVAQYVTSGTAIKTMGQQNSNNRAAVESSVAGTVLTPADGTKVLTLVDAGNGMLALQASNGKYLYAAGGTSSNHLKEQSNIDYKAQWTIEIANTGIATIKANITGSNKRDWMRYNTSGLFSCYGSGQTDIVLYANLVKISGETVDASTITDNTSVVVPDGTTLSSGADKTLRNVIIKEGGVMEAAAGTLNVNDVTINSMAGKSGQVLGTNVNVTGNLYLEIKLRDGDMDAEASRLWYCISAPFDVNMNGGFFWGDGTPMVLNTHFQLFEYDGQKRANTGNGWKRVNGTMKANTAYFIGFDDAQSNQNTIKLKANAKTIPAVAPIALNEYSAADEANANWNAVANPTLRYVGLDKTVQVFDPENQNYNPFPYFDAAYAFVVGTPFFYKGTGSIVLNTDHHDQYRAPQHRAESYNYCVQISKAETERFDNQLYVVASETAAATYEEGQDVPSMNEETSKYGALIWTENYGDKRLAIEEAPLVNSSASYVLGIYAPEDGEYTISTPQAKEDVSLYLTREGRVIWDLTAAPYTLDLTKGNTTGYGLRIVAAPKATTDLEDVQGDKVQCTKVLINNHVFILRGEQLYDATGRLVK